MKHSFLLLLVLFGFTAFLRIIELIFAKKNKKFHLKENKCLYYKEPYYPAFIVLHGSFLLLTPLEVYYLQRKFHLWIGIFSFLVYLLCLILRFHILKVLKDRWNTEIIYDLDKNFIVTSGIYQYIRHPNYLVVILEIFSLSLFHSAWISLVVFSVLNLFLLLKFRIPTEEKLLFQNPLYKAHFSSKGRFLPF